MYIKAMGVVLALVCCSASAQDSAWIELAISKDSDLTYSAKAGSWRIQKNKQGKQASTFTGRVTSKKADSVEFNNWYVTLEDCEKGQGKLTALAVSGSFKYETDFVSDGGNIASAIASMLCELAKQGAKQP